MHHRSATYPQKHLGPQPQHCDVFPQTNVLMVALMSVLSVFILLSLAQPAIAQTMPMPENASPKNYGDGWSCDIGYRIDGDLCAEISIPPNAYKTNRTYGAGWECVHGFRNADGGSCVEVVVPTGGFLDPSGARWNCLRGYLKVDEVCREVVVPENAYLTDNTAGPSWACNRGFQVKGDACADISVPTNAYLNDNGYGRPWTCDRGFFEKAGACEAVVIPANAYFDEASYGNGWRCDRGYAVSGDQCEAIDLPDNAHFDRSGNRWDCNRNFRKFKGLCVLIN